MILPTLIALTAAARRGTTIVDSALARLKARLVERQNRIDAPARLQRFLRVYEAAVEQGSSPAAATHVAFALTSVDGSFLYDDRCFECSTVGTTFCEQCQVKSEGRLFV